MANMRDLQPGAKVRLTSSFRTFYGHWMDEGLTGVVSDVSPTFTNDGRRQIWIWWDVDRGKSGAWVEITRLRMRRRRASGQS